MTHYIKSVRRFRASSLSDKTQRLNGLLALVRCNVVYLGLRHKMLTRLLSACYDSGAFSQIVGSALFLPNEYGQPKAPRLRGLFLFGLVRVGRSRCGSEGFGSRFRGHLRAAGEPGHHVLGETPQCRDARRAVEQNVLDADLAEVLDLFADLVRRAIDGPGFG